MNFRKLLFKSDKKKLSFRSVESKKVCSHPGRDLLYSILQVFSDFSLFCFILLCFLYIVALAILY